jgi:hypothetical protein
MSDKQPKGLDLNKALPAETAEQFKVVGLETRQSTKVVSPKYGEVDFKTLSIKTAESLIKKGFPFIVKKAKNEPAATSKSK